MRAPNFLSLPKSFFVAGMAASLMAWASLGAGCASAKEKKAQDMGSKLGVPAGQPIHIATPGISGIFTAGRTEGRQQVILDPAKSATLQFALRVERGQPDGELRVFAGNALVFRYSSMAWNPRDFELPISIPLHTPATTALQELRLVVSPESSTTRFIVREARVALDAIGATTQPGGMK